MRRGDIATTIEIPQILSLSTIFITVMFHAFLWQKSFRIFRAYLGYKAFKLFWVLSYQLWLEKIDVIFNRVWRGARRFSFPNNFHNSRKLMLLISICTIFLGYYATESLSRLQKVETQVYVGGQATNEDSQTMISNLNDGEKFWKGWQV